MLILQKDTGVLRTGGRKCQLRRPTVSCKLPLEAVSSTRFQARSSLGPHLRAVLSSEVEKSFEESTKARQYRMSSFPSFWIPDEMGAVV